MTLQELIEAVKEERLTKDQLEAYRNQMSDLFSKMQFEMADIEKEEAIYMNGKQDEESVASRKIAWKATQGGQRLIELKRYALATKEMLNSLKSRLYSIY